MLLGRAKWARTARAAGTSVVPSLAASLRSRRGEGRMMGPRGNAPGERLTLNAFLISEDADASLPTAESALPGSSSVISIAAIRFHYDN
jgi:hypothetical protein